MTMTEVEDGERVDEVVGAGGSGDGGGGGGGGSSGDGRERECGTEESRESLCG